MGIGTVREGVVRRRGRSRSGEFAVKEKRALLEGDRKPGPAGCAAQTPQSVPLQHNERTEDEEERAVGTCVVLCGRSKAFGPWAARNASKTPRITDIQI